MSRYRDDLKAARLRTAALEAELDEHEEQLAAQDEQIATLKEQLAARDDQLARAGQQDEHAEPIERDVISDDGRRMKLQRLEPRSSSSVVAIVALVIMAFAIIVIFSLMVRM